MEVETNRTESKKSLSCWWDSHASLENSKWLAENLEEMDQSVKRMLKMIEEDGMSLAKNDDKYYQNKPGLTAHVEEFYRIYQSLAERYDHLIEKLRKSAQSEFQVQGSGIFESGSGQGSPLATPDQKLGLHKFGHQTASFSSGGGSSDLSLKEGTESISSSSDSESESFNSSVSDYLGSPVNIVGKETGTELSSMKEKLHVAEEDNADCILKVGGNGKYEELLQRFIKYEENLRDSNLKLKISEEEVARLKSELEKHKSVVLAENVHDQLKSAQRDIKMREADLELERIQVCELQNKIAELETHVSDSNFEIGRLMEELEKSRERLKGSDEEFAKLKYEIAKEISEGTHQVQGQLKLAQEDIAMLRAKLDSERVQVLDLQEKIVRYKTDLSGRDHEVRELKVALDDAQKNFSLEKAQLQSGISSLSAKQTLLDARIIEWELQGKLLEDKIWQCEAEKMAMKGLYDAQEIGLRSQINRLEVEHAKRGEHVDTLNKSFDRLKLKYDTLMAEKDGVIAKVNTLISDVSSKDNQIVQMEEHLCQLHKEHVELMAGCKSAWKLVDELRLKVEELEKEVGRQRIVILDGAEEKREVIRQLCFSLEHYRSGYKELRQVFLGNKHRAVMTA